MIKKLIILATLLFLLLRCITTVQDNKYPVTIDTSPTSVNFSSSDKINENNNTDMSSMEPDNQTESKLEEINEGIPPGLIWSEDGNNRKIDSWRYPDFSSFEDIDSIEVELSLSVLPNGSVSDIKIIKSSGYSLVDISAVNALKEWKFAPALNSDPMTARIIIKIHKKVN